MADQKPAAPAPQETPKAPADPNPTPEVKPTETPAPEPKKEPAAPAPAGDGKLPAPDKYDLKLPEGSLLDTSHLETIASYAKERGLSQEDAQKQVERDNALVTAHEKKQQENLKKVAEKWLADSKADKEIGGEKLTENVQLAQRVLKKFGDPELNKLLDSSGLGNNPQLLKLLSKVGRAMHDDQLVVSERKGGGGKDVPLEDRIYGKPKEKN